MAAIVLAGGKSSRLGRDKAFVQINGRSLIERVVEILFGLGDQVFIVSNDPAKFSGIKGVDTLRDFRPSLGPLGGIYTGLAASPDKNNIIVPCDAPFMQPALLDYLISGLRESDALVPIYHDRLQTTTAAYSRTCLPSIKKSIDGSILKVASFFTEIQVEYLDDDIISRLDREGLSFFNVNTRDDLAEARMIALKRERRRNVEK